MDNPKLVGIKVELRFDTEEGKTLKDCLPIAHDTMKERLGLDPKQYMLRDYAIDENDQNARVITVLVGVGDER